MVLDIFLIKRFVWNSLREKWCTHVSGPVLCICNGYKWDPYWRFPIYPWLLLYLQCPYHLLSPACNKSLGSTHRSQTQPVKQWSPAFSSPRSLFNSKRKLRSTTLISSKNPTQGGHIYYVLQFLLKAECTRNKSTQRRAVVQLFLFNAQYSN